MSVRNLDISLFELPQSTEGISGMHMPDDRAQSGPMGMPDERVYQRESKVDDVGVEFEAELPEPEERADHGPGVDFGPSYTGSPYGTQRLGDYTFAGPWWVGSPEDQAMNEAMAEFNASIEDSKQARERELKLTPDERRAARKRRNEAYHKLNEVRGKWLDFMAKGEKERSLIYPKRRKALNKARMQDLLPGGLGDYKNISDFKPEQVGLGLEHEMEHTDNPAIALEISKDHLTEDPEYYTKLQKIEGFNKNLRYQLRKQALGILDIPADSMSQRPVANRLGIDDNEVANQLIGADSPVDTDLHPKNDRDENYEYSKTKGEDPNFIHFLFGDKDNMRPALEELKSSMKVTGRVKQAEQVSKLIYRVAQYVNPSPKVLDDAPFMQEYIGSGAQEGSVATDTSSVNTSYQEYLDSYQSFIDRISMFFNFGPFKRSPDPAFNQEIIGILNRYNPTKSTIDGLHLKNDIDVVMTKWKFGDKMYRDIWEPLLDRLINLATKVKVMGGNEYHPSQFPMHRTQPHQVQQTPAIKRPPQTIHYLDERETVREVQKLLGFPPPQDGLWGARTQTAWLAKKPIGALEEPKSAADALLALSPVKVTEKPISAQLPGQSETSAPQAAKANLIDYRMDGPEGRPVGVIDYGQGRYGGATVKDDKWVPTQLTAKEQRFLGLGKLQTGMFGPAGRRQRDMGGDLRRERRSSERISSLDEIRKHL